MFTAHKVEDFVHNLKKELTVYIIFSSLSPYQMCFGDFRYCQFTGRQNSVSTELSGFYYRRVRISPRPCESLTLCTSIFYRSVKSLRVLATEFNNLFFRRCEKAPAFYDYFSAKHVNNEMCSSL